MKNFPHQFNDLTKLYNALNVIRSLINSGIPLTDENFGEQLTRQGIYTYRDTTLTIDQFLANEKTKPASNRGYLTVSRDIRRFFELLGFITVFEDKTARLSPSANQLLIETSPEIKKGHWKNALLQLGLEGTDGEVSHPYRILLKLVSTFPGIETAKLMLALEAENDSEEELERIVNLANLSIDEIIEETGTSVAMAKNAVKILPGIAEQLGDIERVGNHSYSIGQVVVTEDEITTEESESPTRTRPAVQFRGTSAADIARDPNLNTVTSVSIDLAESIRTRQRRLAEHQELVRLLASIVEARGFGLFEGKFDCLAVKDGNALLFEVKTLLPSTSDEEKQTVKGVGQLKYYKFAIVHQQMGHNNIKEFIVFSIRPSVGIIEFCTAENIFVMWRDGQTFRVLNRTTRADDLFDPDNFVS
jgi:hypothetical protein